MIKHEATLLSHIYKQFSTTTANLPAIFIAEVFDYFSQTRGIGCFNCLWSIYILNIFAIFKFHNTNLGCERDLSTLIIT